MIFYNLVTNTMPAHLVLPL